MTRSAISLLLTLLLLATGFAGQGLVDPGAAEPRIIGGERPPVRILRGGTSAPAAAGPAIDLRAAAPAGVDSAARAAARRLVDAFGGPMAFTLWHERGERRGRQAIVAPARVESRFRDRRATARRRVDLMVAGAGIAFVTGPEGAWQSFLGLVSDLPEREREELQVEAAHDEGLLLGAAEGRLPARLDPGAAAGGEIALVVWGPRGSATRFRADAGSGRLRQLEFTDLDPRGQGDAFQVRTFDDWRAFGPASGPLLAPVDGVAPLAWRDRIDDLLLVESVIDTLDLGRSFPDSVFARPGAVERTSGPSRRVIIPLERSGDHDFVALRLGVGPTRRFLVDTGAGMTAISLELAQELGLAGEALEIVGLGGGTAAHAVLLPPLALGHFSLEGVHGLALDLTELRTGLGADLDGILGFSALARYAVTFDFARGQLELAENAAARVPGAGGTRMPIVMVAGQVIVPVRVDGGEESSFLVDSGAWRTFLPPEVGARLNVPPERRLPGIPSSGADGRPVEAEAVRVRSLRVGDVEVSRPIVLVPAHADSGGSGAWSLVTHARGVLGADFLRRFRVTIDFPRQELTLEPAMAGPRPTGEEGDTSFMGPGIVVRAGVTGASASARVRRVLAGSPAERAGLRVGDRVFAIDGAPTAGLRAESLRQRLAGPAGSRVRLDLRDGRGRARTVTLERVLLL